MTSGWPPWPPVPATRATHRPGFGLTLVCTLFCGTLEVEGTLLDAQGGPVLAAFGGGPVYRAAD
jgi:hypothetical protein